VRRRNESKEKSLAVFIFGVDDGLKGKAEVGLRALGSDIWIRL
jgi:hypothetical protein